MPRITTDHEIAAPIARCFDLARSIDFHQHSLRASRERAVAGVTRGLIGPGDDVTWRARHFGIVRHLTSRVTRFEPPFLFADEQVRGAFAWFRHEHRFEVRSESRTRAVDTFDFASPLGPLGRLADAIFLTAYMTRLLRGHAANLKAALESERWREFLPAQELH